MSDVLVTLLNDLADKAIASTNNPLIFHRPSMILGIVVWKDTSAEIQADAEAGLIGEKTFLAKSEFSGIYYEISHMPDFYCHRCYDLKAMRTSSRMWYEKNVFGFGLDTALNAKWRADTLRRIMRLRAVESSPTAQALEAMTAVEIKAKVHELIHGAKSRKQVRATAEKLSALMVNMDMENTQRVTFGAGHGKP